MRFWGLLFICVAGAVILLGLGTWQIQRMAWKQTVLAEIDAQISNPPVGLDSLGPISPDTHRLRPVKVTGTYTDDPAVRFLVSQKIYGAGYRFVGPFVTDTGRKVLIDRGYARLEAAVPSPAQTLTTITGNLYWPDETDSFTPDNDLAANIWFSRDVAVLADHFGTEPVYIIASDIMPDEASVAPLPITSAGIPNDHLQYAITWFSLAFIWVAMIGYLLYRQTKDDKLKA